MSATTPLPALALLALSPVLASRLAAQIFEVDFQRNQTLTETTVYGDGMGTSVAVAGDVNADGFADLIVGNPRTGAQGINSGSAFIYSGKDWSLLWRFDGGGGDYLGIAVAGAGDMDGDGLADVVVGAPGANGFRGSAIVYSATGSVLWRFDGPQPSNWPQMSVAGGVDVNRDGFPDVVVGFPRVEVRGLEYAGNAFVYSGKDGTVLFQFGGEEIGELLGTAVAVAGDVNGDGFPDVAVGSPYYHGEGSVRLFSGFNGTQLWSYRGESHRGLGEVIAPAGDVNGDGLADVIVGNYRARTDGDLAFVLSGRDGALLWSFKGGVADDRLNIAVAGAGDVNGDGVPDLLVGTGYARPNGAAFLYSGKDGTALWRFDGMTGSRLGSSVAGAGDIDQDGLVDVILGAPRTPYSGLPGSAFVYSASVFQHEPAFVAYGNGLPGTRDVTPVLATNGEPVRPGSRFQISLQAGLGVSPALIAASTTKAQTPLSGLTLYGDFLTPGAYSTWSLMTGGFPGIGATGIATLELLIPNDPSLRGLTTFWQGFVMDPASPAPAGVSHTAGLAVTIVR